MIGRLFRRFWHEGIWIRLIGAAAAIILLQVTPVPQAPLAALRRAVKLSGAGKHKQAAQALSAVYQYQPWSADRLAFRVQEDLLGFDLGGAQRDLERLASVRPLTTSELVALSAIYIRQGEMIQAEQIWREAVTTRTVDQPALAKLADSAVARQDWPSASAALLGLTVMVPNDPQPVYRLGLVQAFDEPQYAPGTLNRAASMDSTLVRTVTPVEQALAAWGVDPAEQVYARLGVLYVNLSEFELAESALSRAYAINPAYAEALAYLAYARARLGRPALGAMHQALSLSPTSPVIHYLSGLCLRQIGRIQDARAEFETAYDLDPTNPAFAVEIASTHRAEHASQYAEIWLAEAVRLAPNDVRFRLLLIEFYVDDNYRLQDAGLPLAEQLVAQQPNNAEAHAVLGWAAFRLGDPARALAELTRAVELDPLLARAQLHLAVVNESQGEVQNAIQEYQRASALDPHGNYGALARRALQRLGVE